ncbi:MAG: IscS subfamily cysteine desulfurase [Gammaproteobacteria bacterium]
MDAQRPLYLDYMATTPVDPRVAARMSECLTRDGAFGNPASATHTYGADASALVETARAQVAALVNADPREIVWTSGATEADNLAIKGAAWFHENRGRHIVTSRTEHKAVIDTCRWLERRGWTVTWLEPGADGRVEAEQVRDALTAETIVVAIMHVNNEIGVINDIAAIGEVCRAHGCQFHVDAAQSAGKLPLDLQRLPVDTMAFSAHKTYGPKGAGALFVRREPRARLEALIHGGGHERGLRSGTLATHQAVGMGEAFRIAAVEMPEEQRRILALRERFATALSKLPGVHLNGHPTERVAGNLNLSFAGVHGDALLLALRDLALSTGSACNSAAGAPSYVLRALGRSDALANASIRFSFGRWTTEAEVDHAATRVAEAVDRLRALSPLWGDTAIDTARKVAS